MGVYKKLHQLQQVTRSLSPDAKGQTGAAHYPYVSGSKLLSVIRPAMDNLGLILLQEVKEITNTPMTYPTAKGDRLEMFTSVHMVFTWVDAETGEKVSEDFFANGMNAFDKGLGSALTYGERYFLMKTFHIATDEDDIDALNKEEAVKVIPQNPFGDNPPAPKPKATEKPEFSPERPKEWNSALEKFKAGKLTRKDIERRCVVSDEIWEVFIHEVELIRAMDTIDDN